MCKQRVLNQITHMLFFLWYGEESLSGCRAFDAGCPMPEHDCNACLSELAFQCKAICSAASAEHVNIHVQRHNVYISTITHHISVTSHCKRTRATNEDQDKQTSPMKSPRNFRRQMLIFVSKSLSSTAIVICARRGNEIAANKNKL